MPLLPKFKSTKTLFFSKSISKFHQSFKIKQTPVSSFSTYETFFYNLDSPALTNFFKTTHLFFNFALILSTPSILISFKNLDLIHKIWSDPTSYITTNRLLTTTTQMTRTYKRKLGSLAQLKNARRGGAKVLLPQKINFITHRCTPDFWNFLNQKTRRLVGTPKSVYLRKSAITTADKITFIKQWRRRKTPLIKPYIAETHKFLNPTANTISLNPQSQFLIQKLKTSAFFNNLILIKPQSPGVYTSPNSLKWRHKVKLSTNFKKNTPKFKPYLFLNLTSISRKNKNNRFSLVKLFFSLTDFYLYEKVGGRSQVRNQQTPISILSPRRATYFTSLPSTNPIHVSTFQKLPTLELTQNSFNEFFKAFISFDLSPSRTVYTGSPIPLQKIKNLNLHSNPRTLNLGLTRWLVNHRKINLLAHRRHTKKGRANTIISNTFTYPVSYHPTTSNNCVLPNLSSKHSTPKQDSSVLPPKQRYFKFCLSDKVIRTFLWYLFKLNQSKSLNLLGTTRHTISTISQLFKSIFKKTLPLATLSFMVKNINLILINSTPQSTNPSLFFKKQQCLNSLRTGIHLTSPLSLFFNNPKFRKKKPHTLANKGLLNSVRTSSTASLLKPMRLLNIKTNVYLNYVRKCYLKKKHLPSRSSSISWHLTSKRFTALFSQKIRNRYQLNLITSMWRQRLIKRFNRYSFRIVEKNKRLKRFSLAKTSFLKLNTPFKNYSFSSFKLILEDQECLYNFFKLKSYWKVWSNNPPLTPKLITYRFGLYKPSLLNNVKSINYFNKTYLFFKPETVNTFHRSAFFYVQFLALLKALPQLRLAKMRSSFYYEPYDFVNLRYFKKTLFQRLIYRKYRMDRLKNRNTRSTLNSSVSNINYNFLGDFRSKQFLNSPKPSNSNLFLTKDLTSLMYTKLGLMYSETNLKKAKKTRFVKKTRFKPGYPRIWRTERKILKQALNLTHRYQYRLTKKLQYRYFPSRQFRNNFFELKLEQVLIFSSFTSDELTVRAFLTNEYVYLNGVLTTNGDLRLFLNDFIQLVITLRFYVLFKWIKNSTRTRFTKWLKKFYKTYRIKRQLFREFTFRELPDSVLALKNSWYDIPRNIEVDYFTLSIFVIQNTYGQNLLTPYPSNFFKLHILNVYNWKYLT